MKENFLASIYNKKSEILLQRRQGTKLWCGFLDLPVGHVDKGKNVYDALTRETKEELNIDVNVNNIIDIFIVNRTNKTLNPIQKQDLNLVFFLYQPHQKSV